MAGNELQYALIGSGAVLVVALVGYNVWQERRARRHAEQAFRSMHRDVLLDEEGEAAIPPAPGGRMEPSLPTDPVPEARIEPHIDPAPNAAAAATVQPAMRAQEPVLPWELKAIDCVVPVEAPAGVSASSLFVAQQSTLAGVARRLAWYGWDDSDNNWIALDARTPGSVTRACAALQLVDRRGRVSEAELERFYDQIQLLCDQFLAVPRLPARSEVLTHAAQLDQFASECDIQIAINVVATKAAFAGTKLRGLAEAAGLVLLTDGHYHFRDEADRTLFTLSNQEAAPLSVEQLRYLHTHGLTLMIDVPRVARPVQAFDKMIAFAHHLAEALEGAVVDDNRTPLSDRSVGLIREQIGQFAQHMEEQGIPAGGDVARRLFA